MGYAVFLGVRGIVRRIQRSVDQNAYNYTDIEEFEDLATWVYNHTTNTPGD